MTSYPPRTLGPAKNLPTRTRVAMLTTRHSAQDDRIYFKQALSIAKRFDVVVIAPDDGDDLAWQDGIESVPIPRRSTILGRLWNLAEAVTAVRKSNVGVCHFHDLDLVLAVPALRLLTRAKLVFDSHEAYPQQMLVSPKIPDYARPFTSWLVNIVEKTLVRLCHHVVTADLPTRESFATHGIPSTCVFNYPPLEIFDTDDSVLREQASRYRGRLPIIYQGTASPDRGLFHMIEALPFIRSRCASVLLRIVGLKDPRLQAESRRRASELGVEELLEITPWVPHQEIGYPMKTSLLGLAPWQPEEKHKRNIPIKIFEYMACGLPVVAADLPSIAPYILDSGSGVLYDSTNAEELARCVVELLENSEERLRMAESGLKAVRDKWNWGAMESVLLDVYASLDVSEERIR